MCGPRWTCHQIAVCNGIIHFEIDVLGARGAHFGRDCRVGRCLNAPTFETGKASGEAQSQLRLASEDTKA